MKTSRTGLLVSLMILAINHLNADALDRIAGKLSSYAPQLKNKQIAVFPFPYHDAYEGKLSILISERLITKLSERRKFTIVERLRLDKVLHELKLEHTGLIQEDSAKQLGKILGVEAIVTGTLVQMDGKQVEINARLIHTESGTVLKAAGETISIDLVEEKKDETTDMRAFFHTRENHSRIPSRFSPPEKQPKAKVYLSNVDGTAVSGIKGREIIDSPYLFIRSLGPNEDQNSGEFKELQLAWKASFMDDEKVASMLTFARLKESFLSQNKEKLALLARLYLTESYFNEGLFKETIREARIIAKKTASARLKGYAYYYIARASESLGHYTIASELYRDIIKNFPFEQKLIRSAGYRLFFPQKRKMPEPKVYQPKQTKYPVYYKYVPPSFPTKGKKYW